MLGGAELTWVPIVWHALIAIVAVAAQASVQLQRGSRRHLVLPRGGLAGPESGVAPPPSRPKLLLCQT